MKINIEGYELTGTPAEILELLGLLAEEVAAVEKPAPAPETPEKPKPAPRKSGGEERGLEQSESTQGGRLVIREDR